MKYFKAKDSAKLFYSDSGEGTPVILIHGWPVNADMWEYQKLELLRRGFRVIAYDRRGFGRSDQTATGYDYNTFADDLNSLVEHLEVPKVQLVGFSMGGGEIARYLTGYGASKISSATLVSSVVPYMQKDDSNPKGVDGSVFAQIQSGLEEDRPHFLAGFTKDFFGVSLINQAVSAETLQWCQSMAMQASLKATIECVTAFGTTDFRGDLKSFTVPTLVIHGTSDKTVPFETAGEAAAKGIPGSKYIPYDDAPHGLFITHKHKLNADLVTFLTANADRAAYESSKLSKPTVERTVELDRLS